MAVFKFVFNSSIVQARVLQMVEFIGTPFRVFERKGITVLLWAVIRLKKKPPAP